MGLDRLESFLENNIEGFFNRKFASNLEPAELMKGIEKEVMRQAARDKEHRGIANRYEFQLSADDYKRLCSDRLENDLLTELERQIILADSSAEGRLSVVLKENAGLTRGSYELKANFAVEDVAEAADQEHPHTLVLERHKLTADRPLNPPLEHYPASLTVVEGPDLDAYLELGERNVYIGRLSKNEFILTDTNVSRLHAWVSYEHHRHYINDAQSTNGTFVNDEPISGPCLLQAGDEIRLGETILSYEVS